MKKNKTVAYMLAATLLVGGTFAGTKALFQDTETSTNPLILTTGKVDISVSDNTVWTKYDKNGKFLDTGESFTGVTPGDKYVKIINISNEDSTYDVNLKVEEAIDNNNKIPENLKKHITVNKEVAENISKGESVEMRVEVSLSDTKEAWNDLNGQNLSLDNVYQITAIQAK